MAGVRNVQRLHPVTDQERFGSIEPLSAIKKSISMPEDLWERADARRRNLGYNTMSAYLQYLVREDLITLKPHTRSLEAPSKGRQRTGTASARYPAHGEHNPRLNEP